MWEWIGYLVLKVLMGTSFYLILNNKKKKMRIIEHFTSDVKTDVLSMYVSFAKGEIEELGNPLDLPLLVIARSYDWSFESIIKDYEDFVVVESVIAWTGPRPPHMPR